MPRRPNKQIPHTCSCGIAFTLLRTQKNPRCPECVKREAKERCPSPYEKYAKGNRKYQEKRHEWSLMSNYGLTLDQYYDMFEAQQGRCKICWHPETRHPNLCVDHDHQTGAVRGLLCHACNRVLGSIKEDTEILHEMIRYLEKAKSNERALGRKTHGTSTIPDHLG